MTVLSKINAIELCMQKGAVAVVRRSSVARAAARKGAVSARGHSAFIVSGVTFFISVTVTCDSVIQAV